jgi:esterase/lipase superfamily enzyme
MFRRRSVDLALVIKLIIFSSLLAGKASTLEVKLLTGMVLVEGKPADSIPVRFCEEDSTQPAHCSAIITTLTDSGGRFVFALPRLNPSHTYSLRATYVPLCTAFDTLGRGDAIRSWLKNQVLTISELDCPSGTPSMVGHQRAPDSLKPDTSKMRILQVFYATDRQLQTVQQETSVSNVNNPSGILSFGTCRVAITSEDEPIGSVGRLLYERNPSSNSWVQAIRNAEWDVIRSELTSTLRRQGSRDALLFIHGYNTSFDEACRRAAQLASEIKFGGAILLYSWPSHYSWRKYVGDEEMVEWSQPHFNRFLKGILNMNEIGRLHIVAHSMGSRLITRALSSGVVSNDERQRLGEIVLAAPDVNRLIFEQYHGYKTATDQRVTLYASDHDQALKLSKWFHGYGRAGDAMPRMEVVEGVESIDASAVDTSLLGHSYLSESRPVLADLSSLILLNTEPDKRFGLRSVGQPPKNWWLMEP